MTAYDSSHHLQTRGDTRDLRASVGTDSYVNHTRSSIRSKTNTVKPATIKSGLGYHMSS